MDRFPERAGVRGGTGKVQSQPLGAGMRSPRVRTHRSPVRVYDAELGLRLCVLREIGCVFVPSLHADMSQRLPLTQHRKKNGLPFWGK